jgi:hypothetical protein
LTALPDALKLRRIVRARLTPRLVSLAALLPLLAFAMSSVGYDRFRCAFSGEVSEDGCCPGDVDAGPATPTLVNASCCDHESARPVKVPALSSDARHAVAIDLPPVAPQLAACFAPADGARIPRPASSHAPPPTPLLLLKQSFLI